MDGGERENGSRGVALRLRAALSGVRMVWIFLALMGACSAAIAISAVLRSRAEFDTPRAHVARILSRLAKAVMVVLLLAWSAWALIPPSHRYRIALRYFGIPLGIPEYAYWSPFGSAAGLHQLDCETLLDIYADLLTDSDPNVRSSVAQAHGEFAYLPYFDEDLRPIENAAALAKLQLATHDESPAVAVVALMLIGQSRNAAMADFLIEELRSAASDEERSLAVVYALSLTPDPRIADTLLAIAGDPGRSVRLRSAAVNGLSEHPSAKAFEALRAFAAGNDADMALAAYSTASSFILNAHWGPDGDKQKAAAAAESVKAVLLAFASNTKVPLDDRLLNVSEHPYATGSLAKEMLLGLLKEGLSARESAKGLVEQILDHLESVERQTGEQISDQEYLAAKAKRDAERPREDPKMAGKAKKAKAKKAASAE